MESGGKCPYCGRNLGEDGFYCYFCDAEMPEPEKNQETKQKKAHGKH